MVPIAVANSDEMTLELRLRLYQIVESHRTAVDGQRDRRSCGSSFEQIETIRFPHKIVRMLWTELNQYTSGGEDIKHWKRFVMKEFQICT